MGSGDGWAIGIGGFWVERLVIGCVDVVQGLLIAPCAIRHDEDAVNVGDGRLTILIQDELRYRKKKRDELVL